MIKNLLLTAATAVAILSQPALAEPNTKADIVDVAVKADSFKTLVAAVKAAGLVDVLKGDGPFTVFAPTDEAFKKLPEGTVESLLKPENKDKLVSILKYHVIPAKVMAKDVKSGKVKKVIKKPKAETPQASPETHIEVTAVVAGRDITKVFEQGALLVVHSQGIRKATRDDLAAATLQAHKATELIRYLVNSCPESEVLALAGHLVKAADALAPAGTSSGGKAPSVSQLKTIWRQAAEDAGVSSQLLGAVDDWAEHKQSLAGKDKVRTVKSWKTALKRILKVSQARGDAAVAEMIDKAIANGWRGWEHDNGGTAGRNDRSRVRTGDVSMEFDEVI